MIKYVNCIYLRHFFLHCVRVSCAKTKEKQTKTNEKKAVQMIYAIYVRKKNCRLCFSPFTLRIATKLALAEHCRIALCVIQLSFFLLSVLLLLSLSAESRMWLFIHWKRKLKIPTAKYTIFLIKIVVNSSTKQLVYVGGVAGAVKETNSESMSVGCQTITRSRPPEFHNEHFLRFAMRFFVFFLFSPYFFFCFTPIKKTFTRTRKINKRGF